jgi:hypothetical protein
MTSNKDQQEHRQSSNLARYALSESLKAFIDDLRARHLPLSLRGFRCPYMGEIDEALRST